MTPLHFEQLYQAEWAELETLVGRVLGRETRNKKEPKLPVPGARLASLYRRACEHLALARARSYPAYIVDRLERITADAHQLIYQRRQFSLGAFRDLFAFEFPNAVRRQWKYVAVSAAAFLVPTIVLGFLTYWQPDLILSLISAANAEQFEKMYSADAQSIGRIRTVTTDWLMFGFYIRNNVGVAFQCFASGLFAGIGSLFFLVFNGAYGGAVAGYLTNRGLSSTFYSFVATHSAFELTAIVLSGAAGLRIGHALLAPGRMTRSQSLIHATRETTALIYGVTAMLVIAAAIEAFWSSATWLPPAAKYASALICWLSVLGYFISQGRRAN
jgi:uncharacterized membrane protein SpoIIM required for sporulation